jgi:hypothetical protein
MYYLKIFVVGLSLLSFAGQQKAGSSAGLSAGITAGDEAGIGRGLPVGNQIGIYLSPGDFMQHKLSYTGDCASGDCTIRLHELFGSSTVDMICNGKKQVFSKDKVYGYRDCKQSDYRFFGESAYQVIDTAGFYLYSVNKLVQGEKIARPQTLYYYSVRSDDPVQELTMANLEKSFAGNARFRYQLEAQFRSDNDLIAYDGLMKEYKIKYVYSQSSK